MVKAALMARFQKFIVDLPSIVSQPTLVVGSQDGSRFVKATARQNVAEGYLLAHRHPEPAQLRGHIPPGLVCNAADRTRVRKNSRIIPLQGQRSVLIAYLL